MGLLSEGTPLSWEETKKAANHVRKHGIEQFINIYHKYKDLTFDVLKWGDEVIIFKSYEILMFYRHLYFCECVVKHCIIDRKVGSF